MQSKSVYYMLKGMLAEEPEKEKEVLAKVEEMKNLLEKGNENHMMAMTLVIYEFYPEIFD